MGIWLGRIAFSLAFAGAGVYLLRAAWLYWHEMQAWKSKGIVTEGEIVAFETKTPTGDSALGPFYAPVVRFHIENGPSMKFRSSEYARPNPYTVGQRVAVRYRRDDPNMADLDAVTKSRWAFVVLIVMMLVAFTVATLPLVLR